MAHLLTRAILALLSGFAPGRAPAPYLGSVQLVSAWRVASILVLPALRRVSMQLLIQRTWCSIETNRLLSGRVARLGNDEHWGSR